MTAAHSDGIARRPSSNQLATIAPRSIVRIPPVSGTSESALRSAGASDTSRSRAVLASAIRRGLAARRPPVHGTSGHLGGCLHALRQTGLARERGEACYRCVELQFDSTCRPMALLADDDFGFAMHFVGLRQPFREFFAIGFQRLAHLMVVLFTIDEQNHVGVLLDRAGFSQIRELGPFIVAAFHLARQL